VSQTPAVTCPTCRKKGDWFAGAYGPFCSKRCRLVDLGKWFEEEHAITEPLRPDHFEEAAELDVPDPDRTPDRPPPTGTE
jgi:endogenous inhibitor of DNA gyrase (YacG/DUF329 family)